MEASAASETIRGLKGSSLESRGRGRGWTGRGAGLHAYAQSFAIGCAPGARPASSDLNFDSGAMELSSPMGHRLIISGDAQHIRNDVVWTELMISYRISFSD